MTRIRRGAMPLIAVLGGLAAVAGSMVPWETIDVRVAGGQQTRLVGSFHGSGIAACVGAALVLLMAADRLLRPADSAARDAGGAFPGGLLAPGKALFRS